MARRSGEPAAPGAEAHAEPAEVLVIGEGNPNSALVFVGDEPLTGPAGQLFDKMIEAIGLRRAEVYVAQIVNDRSAGDPVRDLRSQLATMRSEIVVALGETAAQVLLKRATALPAFRGQVFDYEGMKLVSTFHPADLLRNPGSKRDAWDDLKKIAGMLGLAIPAKGKSE